MDSVTAIIAGAGPLWERTMKMRTCALLALISLLGTGCATLTKGSNQTITVSTEPSGAICTLSRDGRIVATT